MIPQCLCAARLSRLFTLFLVFSLCACAESDPESERAADAEAARPDAAAGAGAVEAALDAAEQYFNAADLPRARAILLRLIDRAPREPRARELYGQTILAEAAEAREQGRHEAAQHLSREAYEQYRVATELRPNDSGLHQSAGEIAQSAGELETALRHYRRAGELDPNETKHVFFAAQVLIRKSAFQEAEAKLDRARRLAPDEPLTYASLANLSVERGEYGKALGWIEEARSIDPRDVGFRVIEASIHRRQGDPRRSVELLIHLGESERARPMVADELGRALEQIGETAEAGDVWSLVYFANQSHPEAWRWAVRAGQARLTEGRRERARQWLQEARRLQPGQPDHAEVEALAQAFGEGESGHRSRPD